MKREKYMGFWRKFDLHHNFPDIAGRSIVAWFNFNPADHQPLVVKVALSAVSQKGARKNLKAETAGRTFDQVLAQTRLQWERELSMVSCEGTDDQKAMLYTSLYHTMINPSIYQDID